MVVRRLVASRGTSPGLLIAVCAALCAQAQTPWRFWTVADGLPESSTASLEKDARGVLWARHGVAALTRFDGYQITASADTAGGGRMEAGPDGTVWVRRGNVLRRFDGTAWKEMEMPDPGGVPVKARRSSDTNAFIPLRSGRFLVLKADRIAEVDIARKTTRLFLTVGNTRLGAFHSLRRGPSGAIWAAGDRGLGRVDENSAGALEWQEFDAPADTGDLRDPSETGPGELLVAASVAGRPALLQFAGGIWSRVYSANDGNVQGWRGADGELWVGDGNQIFRLGDRRNEAVPRTEALAGVVQGSLQDAAGVFWVTTSQGIARYAPPLWRADAAMRGTETDDLVNAICEDREGGIWFLSSKYLIRFDGKRWNRIPLPARFKPDAGVNSALALLPDGGIAVATSLTHLFIFRPTSGRFEKLQHPRGKTIRMFGRRRNGQLLVETLNGADTHGFNIETFDGHEFHEWLDLSRAPDFWDVRALCESELGDLWIAASDGVGVYGSGKFRRLRGESVPTDGAFSVLETAPGKILFGGRKALYELERGQWRVLAQNLDRARAMTAGSNGVLWIASGTGVHRLAGDAWITNDVNDGLPSAVAYNVLVDRAGRVWAATTRGISLFHPEADRDPPQTIVRDEFNSRRIAPDERVRIVFSGVDKWRFTDSSRLLFSWRLDDAPWSPYARADAASFAKVKPGSHQFEVRAMDRNGNSDPATATFTFSVLAPWYLQPEFLLLTGAGLLVIMYLLRSAWLHHRRIAFDSQHDGLTQLPNRRAFQSQLQRAIQQAGEKTQIALMLVDLDRFKPINDTLGHAAGDLFLQNVAQRMLACVSPHGMLARIGGDEFAVLLEGNRVADLAESVARGFEAALSKPCRIGNKEVASSVSTGIALFPEHATDGVSLQKMADLAMYHCKANARGTYSFFAPFMSPTERGAPRMGELIEESLRKGYFVLHYQPIWSHSGTRVAFEALIRMEHPSLGRINPGEFISVAEATRLIVPLGRWVLNEACRQVAVWRATGDTEICVTVNVSGVQSNQAEFCAWVQDALSQYSLPGSALVLEFPESALVKDPTRARTLFAELRALGVSIALDDFGKGESSLTSLHLLPVDVIKLDRAFTQLNREPVTQGIIPLLRGLGLAVAAKEIETSAQHEALLAAGCTLFQGFLLGRPEPSAGQHDLQCLAQSIQGADRPDPQLDSQTLSGRAETPYRLCQ